MQRKALVPSVVLFICGVVPMIMIVDFILNYFQKEKEWNAIKYEAVIIVKGDTTKGAIPCMPHKGGDTLENHICFYFKDSVTTIRVYAKKM